MHCRGDSKDELYPDELRLDEIKAILDNTTSFAQPIVIITGGEPLTRHDVFDIAAYSISRKFKTVLATCGHYLTDTTVKELIDTGISRISVSLDGATSSSHDSFRGVHGAFDAALKGLEIARIHGLDFQINSTLTTLNIGELDAIHDLAVNLGAVGFHPFLLVPMGRGQSLTDIALSPEDYEAALVRIAEIAAFSPIEIKPTCSPHYTRVIRQMAVSTGKSEICASSDQPTDQSAEIHPINESMTDRHGYTMTRGCLGGQGFVFISHTGKVQMCGFLEIEAGDLRKNGYDLRHIWEKSEFFREIRDFNNYKGKCAICEYINVCGGCRARAYYMTGDYLAEEPNCVYVPQGMKS